MASKSDNRIAEKTGVSSRTVSNMRKKSQSEEEIEALCIESAKRKNNSKKRFVKVESTKKIKVRRIDLKDESSLQDMLADSKERYVKNEQIIGRLQEEIDAQPCLMGGTATGNFQVIPQLGAINNFIKANISLRNQIMDLEEALGIEGKTDEDDPFV